MSEPDLAEVICRAVYHDERPPMDGACRTCTRIAAALAPLLAREREQGAVEALAPVEALFNSMDRSGFYDAYLIKGHVLRDLGAAIADATRIGADQ